MLRKIFLIVVAVAVLAFFGCIVVNLVQYKNADPEAFNQCSNDYASVSLNEMSKYGVKIDIFDIEGSCAQLRSLVEDKEAKEVTETVEEE